MADFPQTIFVNEASVANDGSAHGYPTERDSFKDLFVESKTWLSASGQDDDVISLAVYELREVRRYRLAREGGT